MKSETEPALIKMSTFARKSGVPVPTVKHYLREGLLPEPVRTSRNMAYYDAALIPRVRAIKELQRTLFLPLRVIRELLDGVEIDDDFDPTDFAMRVGIRRALASTTNNDTRTRASLIASGVPSATLELFSSLGIIKPERGGEGDDTHEVYSGDDLALLRILGSARKAGLSHEMLPPEILGSYIEALQNLVTVELSIFREGVVPRAGADLTRLSAIATGLSEQLVVLLRRKLLLPTLKTMLGDANTSGDNDPTDDSQPLSNDSPTPPGEPE